LLRIYDYVDRAVPILRWMFARRERDHRAPGYRPDIAAEPSLF
jgi:hypothetical protein